MNQPVRRLNKQTYLLGTRRLRSYGELLEAFFKEPVEDLLRRLYYEREMSIADIRNFFLQQVGITVDARQIHRLMSKRLSW